MAKLLNRGSETATQVASKIDLFHVTASIARGGISLTTDHFLSSNMAIRAIIFKPQHVAGGNPPSTSPCHICNFARCCHRPAKDRRRDRPADQTSGRPPWLPASTRSRLFAHAYAWHLNFRLGTRHPRSICCTLPIATGCTASRSMSRMANPARFCTPPKAAPPSPRLPQSLGLEIHIETSSTLEADLRAAIADCPCHRGHLGALLSAPCGPAVAGHRHHHRRPANACPRLTPRGPLISCWNSTRT